MLRYLMTISQLQSSKNHVVFWLIVFSFLVSLLARPQFVEAENGNGDYQRTVTLFSAIRSSALDYLKNADQLEIAFQTSISENWPQLQYEGDAIYAELLFRQERYDDLKTHIDRYIDTPELIAATDVYLLLLESKLKLLSRNDDQKEAKALAQQIYERLTELNPNDQITVYRALAYYYTAVDETKMTLEFALNGLELAIKENDNASQGFFHRKIADTYNFFDEKDKAVIYSRKAIDAYEKTQDEHFTAKAYWSLGNALVDVKNTRDGVIYFKKALSYFKAVGMQKGIVFAQYSIADIQAKSGNYDDAIQLAKENIKVAEAAEVFDMQIASMILLTEVYEAQKRWKEADDLSDKTFHIVDKFSRAIYKANFFKNRYRLKKQLGLNGEAFDAIEKQLFFTEKHLQATSESNVRALQVKFEVKEKEDKIIQLAHDNDISELKAKEEQQQKVIWRLGAGIAFFVVITALILLYRQLRQRQKYHSISLTDYLTKSPNRCGILDIAGKAMRKQKVTIAIIDLDHFKKINDSFGHDTGDAVLITFAKATKSALRESDHFGRYGGEEWLLVLNTTQKPIIHQIFNRINSAIEKLCDEIVVGELPKGWKVTFSMGATIQKSDTENLEALIKRADTLLYKVKENGRNHVLID